ncbi:GNAT superfamily N-acetyltransferase [Paenibacillus rhizosphaerae]|uniref:GNAT superfamily N-acetyltransferase n=1 Tax=Paenibacillus rhizosphaerae TaxID=297318 RepID=A0A839TNB5_9BACL|nr:GNAT family N-acetyltransferase [Paenibacillus rhizosphaerae]MBB3128265.1 GNAT superfamily N-acetyltransferase [Paenibacillus rhizosphaerae]
MSLQVRSYCAELEETVKNLSHKAWILFKYNKDYDHQRMSCVFNEDENLISVGYLRHGIADDYDVFEVEMPTNELAFNRMDEVRRALYPTFIDTCQNLRNPNKKTKLVAWKDFYGNREFYEEKGFSPYQTYYKAQRSLEEPIPEVRTPVGVNVKYHPMESREERIQYTELENQFYQGVVYRSVNMLEWMMGGPELHTISAFDGDKLVGSVMCWQTGAVERLFVIPQWRNKGLGRFLITKGFEYHMKNGRNEVETLVNEQNAEAVSLLESMGYNFAVKLKLMSKDIKKKDPKPPPGNIQMT